MNIKEHFLNGLDSFVSVYCNSPDWCGFRKAVPDIMPVNNHAVINTIFI